MIIKLVFLTILIAVNAFFAASEMALISLNDNKIKLMAEKGDKKARHLVKLLGEPSRFLATIQIGITLAGFLASALAAESFADPLVAILDAYNLPVSEAVLKAGIVLAITIILSYFTLVFGELVPKRVAMKKAEGIAFFVVTPLTLLSKITNPFVKLLTASTNFSVRLFGIDPHAPDEHVTEEEIRMMVDVGEEKGSILKHEKVMINNIFEFNNKTAEDVMTHRMEIVGIPAHTELKALIEVLKVKKYSRIPVYEETIDNIIGILHVKDLLDLLELVKVDADRTFELSAYMREPFFIPIQKKIDELFVDLQAAKTHVGIVIDEYGGTAGMITLEDLVEEIVGNIYDEYDEEEDKEVKQIDPSTFEVSGMISLYELEEYLEVELPVEEFETMNGFFISLFGNIPPKGQVSQVEFEHLLIQAVEVTDKRIEKMIIQVMDRGEA
ncbi:hemolysin family protein [Acidaminobacter hydrogenoformans]|uniref:Putative hemolysin n=1 Tax=Acidaminobacter hydrogenoformans DSM 2784 TaxID=1120920 RepID=A0A1G5RWH6_9FIRM|nr:hemolysin family protein [Acidaminobacter hydrogenoformans]SCZ78090.1 putative hemolysin [Acidaminobacter hydrogenoformans DSM 2784]